MTGAEVSVTPSTKTQERVPDLDTTIEPDTDTSREDQAKLIADKKEEFNNELEELSTAQNDYAEDTVKPAEAYLAGARSNVKHSEEALAEQSGVIGWMSGSKKGAEQSLAADRKMADERQAQVEKIKQSQEEAQRLKEEAVALNEQGNTERAVEKLREAKQVLGVKHQVDTSSYTKALTEASATLQAAGDGLETTETVLRTTRNGCVVVGATLATGGVAAAGFGAATAVGAGVAAGTAIGTASNVTEQAGHVAHGNKSVSEAVSDGAKQFNDDLKSSAVASVSTVVAAPVAGKIVGNGANGVVTHVLKGGTAGAAQGVTSTGIQIGADIATGGEVPTAGDALHSLAKNGITGFAGGMIGARGNVARGVSPGRAATITVAEGAADVTASVAIEAADAAIQGREFTASDVISTATQSVQGTIVGELANKQAKQPKVKGPDIDDPGPVILPFPKPQEQSQSTPQVLAKAAGAEGLSQDPLSTPGKLKIYSGPTETPEGALIPREPSRNKSSQKTGKAAVNSNEPETRYLEIANNHPDEILDLNTAVDQVIDLRTKPGSDQIADAQIRNEPEIAAELLKDTLENMADPELAREAILFLRRGGQPTAEEITDPIALRNRLLDERERLTGVPKGSPSEYHTPWPKTEAERQQLSQMLTVGEGMIGKHLEVQQDRGKFGAVVFDTEGNVYLDDGHTVHNRRKITPEQAVERHGAGGDRAHLHVITTDSAGVETNHRLFFDDKGKMMSYTGTGLFEVVTTNKNGNETVEFKKVGNG